MATSRAWGGTFVTSRPSIHTPPASGDSRPAIRRSRVVFPEPDGPRTTSSSREAIVSSSRLDGRDAARISLAHLPDLDLRQGCSLSTSGRYVRRACDVSSVNHPRPADPAGSTCPILPDCCTIVGGRPRGSPRGESTRARQVPMTMPSVLPSNRLDRTLGLLPRYRGRCRRRSGRLQTGCRPARDVQPRRAQSLGLPAVRRVEPPAVKAIGLGAQPDRSLHPRRPGGRGLAAGVRGRSPRADPTGHLRPDRPAADAC